MPNAQALKAFQKVVQDHYATRGRDLPWRAPALHPGLDGTLDPYAILVSEVMLQQTQVGRVVPKYNEFMAALPTVQDLAKAPLSLVLTLWSGLGYNRRAKFLHAVAQHIVQDFGGEFPRTQTELATLPGIGPNTAGAIMAYAYNEPVVFIETNIRTVYIHYFFHDNTTVSDKQLIPLIEASLDRHQPREWYWALMDLGSTLKREVGNAGRSSTAYVKQSRFEGSKRQIRGKILRLLLDGSLAQTDLIRSMNDTRTPEVITDLKNEKLIKVDAKGLVSLPD